MTPNSSKAPQILLRALDASTALGISPRLLWSLTASGALPCVRISRRCVRYRVADLESWAANHASTARTPIALLAQAIPKRQGPRGAFPLTGEDNNAVSGDAIEGTRSDGAAP